MRVILPSQVSPQPLDPLSGGLPGLFLGLRGALLGAVPTALLYFASYDACKRGLERILHGVDARRLGGASDAAGAGKEANSTWGSGGGGRRAAVHIASASAGALVSAFVRVPSDTLKHRVQASGPHSDSLLVTIVIPAVLQ